jgi:hypothetical protein
MRKLKLRTILSYCVLYEIRGSINRVKLRHITKQVKI